MLQCKAQQAECASIGRNPQNDFPAGSLRRRAWYAASYPDVCDWNCGLFGYCNRDSVSGMKYMLRTVGQIETVDEVYLAPKAIDNIPGNCYSVTGHPTYTEMENWIRNKKPIAFSARLGSIYGDGHVLVVYGYDFSNPSDGMVAKWIDTRQRGEDQFAEFDYDDWIDGNGTTISNGLIPLDPVQGGISDIHDYVYINNPKVEYVYPGEYESFSATFHDQNSNGTTATTFNWRMVFYHEEGEYVLGSYTTNNAVNSTYWPFSMPPLPTGYNWLRTASGLVRGSLSVSCTDSDGDNHNDTRSVTYSTPPAPERPVLVAPGYDAFNLSPNITFQWEASYPATSYRLKIGHDAFTVVDVDIDNITTTSQYVTGLGFSEDYYWQVGAKNQWGTTWSETRMFTIRAIQLPTPPILLSPSSNATGLPGNPSFSWQSAAGAQSYRIIVSDNWTGATYYEATTGATNHTIGVNNLLPGGFNYNWLIEAINSDGSVFSSVRTFQTFPNVPAISYPLNGAVVSTNIPKLTWGTLAGTIDYRVQLATDVNFTHMVCDTLIPGEYPEMTKKLAINNHYYWRVNASYRDATSNWSPVYSFTINGTQSVPSNTNAGIFLLVCMVSITGVLALRRKAIYMR